MLGNDSRDDSLAVVETALVSSSQSPDTVSPGRSTEWHLGTDCYCYKFSAVSYNLNLRLTEGLQTQWTALTLPDDLLSMFPRDTFVVVFVILTLSNFFS